MRFVFWFAVISLAELATFFWVQSWIGLGWALAIALTTALVGSYLVRRAGVSVIGRIGDKVNQGSLPGRELTDGACVLVAGAFLISPGFITDALGFLLLVPAVRALVYRIVSKRFANRISVFTNYRGSPTVDWQGEIIDVDEVE